MSTAAWRTEPDGVACRESPWEQEPADEVLVGSPYRLRTTHRANAGNHKAVSSEPWHTSNVSTAFVPILDLAGDSP
jgi:hypothetical protein